MPTSFLNGASNIASTSNSSAMFMSENENAAAWASYIPKKRIDKIALFTTWFKFVSHVHVTLHKHKHTKTECKQKHCTLFTQILL